MTLIDDIIKREVNPFDPTTFKPGNFWREQQDSALTVESIHQEAIADIEALLDLVAKDHRSRTVLLLGDSGSGKSYLLARLKRTLNPKAFFAYISSWADSDYIWRHILRYTVDSLMQVPEGQQEGQQESQLMLWLKSLSAFTKRSVIKGIFKDNFWEILRSDRQRFIQHLKKTYRTANIYNPDIFFGVLHDLTNPELYDLACEWLRGDDLSEESLQALKVKHSIDTEDVAKNILANFGRISTETQPIVLCFDNLDNIPRFPDNCQDFQALFNVNTTIHNDYLKNFLIIISVITNTWKKNVDRIQQADKAGIHQVVQLKRITLEQAEALWAYRLQPLHHQANPQPTSPIFPLTQQSLEQKFPGGRTAPRNVLILGRQDYQSYKDSLVSTPTQTATSTLTPPPLTVDNTQAEFELQWQDESKKIQEKITKISLLSAPELIRMLEEALAALQVQDIKPKLISGKFASYSLSYQKPGKRERAGIVWTEDGNMTRFYSVMNACQKAIDSNLCKTLYLIRAAGVGNAKLAGNKIYRQIFTGSQHSHVTPTLSSVYYLATYHSLVNSVLANELVVAGKTLSLEELEALIRESEILNTCTLLQHLGIVSKTKNSQSNGNGEDNLQPVKQFLLNLVKTQGFMGRNVLIKNTIEQSAQVNQSQVDILIQQLCQANQIQIINPGDPPEAHLICFVPQS
jgi:GTPase SAR1 family protein